MSLIVGSKMFCRVLLVVPVSAMLETGRQQTWSLHVPGHLPAVVAQAVGVVILEIGLGKVDVFDAARVAIKGSLDVLVELIEGFGPANGPLEVVELVLANQFSYGLLKTLVQEERASHSTFSRDDLGQLKARLSLLDLVGDEVNGAATSIAKDEHITILNVP